MSNDNALNSDILRIQTLGTFQVWRQEGILKWPTQKSKALLQILLVEPGRIVSTDQILEYLWPNLQPSKAQNNLWVTISQLRRSLEPDLPPRAHSLYIHKKEEGYCFNLECNYLLDGEAFTICLGDAQSTTSLLEKIKSWEAARDIYRGNYLEDEPYAEWAQFPRIEWKRRYEKLLSNLAEAYGKNGRFQQAIEHCQKILVLDNTNETIYRLLMRCHASLGERTTALKIFDDAARTLEREIDLDPAPETVELAEQIRSMKGSWKLDVEERPYANIEPSTHLPFVGRGAEIEKFSNLLQKSSKGEGELALVSGEPGIGKSRLINETVILASQQEFSPIIARCYQIEQSIPYQPLIDLMRQLIAQDNRWQQLSPVWLRELSILMPEIAAINNSEKDSLPTEEPDKSQQGRLFQAIFHLFANYAKHEKTIIVIEDIHWADPATLQFIHYFSRQVGQFSIILLLSMQDENISANADLTALVNSLQMKSNTALFPLARLTEEDLTELLKQKKDAIFNIDQVAHWLHKETDGNPFFFISLLQSMLEEGLFDKTPKTDFEELTQKHKNLSLPSAIRDSVLGRLQRLSQAEQDVLAWIAVYGRRIVFSTLQTISQQPQITLLNTVEKLLERQLLIEAAGQYDFNHNKIREVTYDDLSAARCSLYHQRIANTLDTSTISLDETALLAHHFERSGENDKALTNWMKAGKHALETYAYQQATQHYERALALVDKRTDEVDVYLGLGNAFILQDDHKAASTILQKGLGLLEGHDRDARVVQLLFAQAQNANRQHRTDGGEAEVKTALMEAEKHNNKYYIAQSLLLLTEVHESNGALSKALETAIQAQKVSHELNNLSLEARALLEIGFLHAQRASFDEAVKVSELGLKLLKTTDDHNATAYAWNILGRALGGRGDYESALDAFRRSKEEAELVGDRYLLAQVFNMKGWLFRELGDYESALKFDNEGVEFAEKWGKPSPEISARLNVCLDLLYLGNPQKALALLDEIEKQINAGSFGFHSWRWQLRLFHTRGLSYLSLNKPQKALVLAREGASLAKKNVTRKYMALNHELEGMALAKLENVDDAIVLLKKAIALADEIHYQPTRWMGRKQLANLYKQANREKDAESILAEAQQIIETIASSIKDEKLQAIFLESTRP